MLLGLGERRTPRLGDVYKTHVRCLLYSAAARRWAVEGSWADPEALGRIDRADPIHAADAINGANRLDKSGPPAPERAVMRKRHGHQVCGGVRPTFEPCCPTQSRSASGR